MDSFTIHGLWPQNYDGTYPTYCNRSEHYDPNAVADLLPRLEVEWPSMSETDDGFWTHEWQKHGSCTDMPEHDYFKKGLELNENYDLMGPLYSANIFPSDDVKYDFDAVLAAFKSGLGVSVEMTCYADDVSEVRMCLSKDFEPIDCTQQKNRHSCRFIRLPLSTSDKKTHRSRSREIDAQLKPLALSEIALLVITVVLVAMIMLSKGRCSIFPDPGKSAIEETSLLEKLPTSTSL